jgi:TonB family protein
MAIRVRAYVGACCVSALVALSSTAAAQDSGRADEPGALSGSPASTPPAITPPAIQHEQAPDYPEEARRLGIEGQVELVLTIDAQGRVQDVQVSAAAGHGFDESAVAAARKLVFTPALRGGGAVASRITYSYAFALPVSRSEPAPAAPTPAPVGAQPAGVEAAPAASTAAVEGGEVVVRSASPPREATRRALDQHELTVLPGTNGDAFRGLQSLPGVGRTPFISNNLIVRGDINESVYVDGTGIPYLYHFGGLSSVLPTEVLERIDFYPGNFSTRYGQEIGAVIDAHVRSPSDDGKLHGLAQVDFIDARVLAEGPVARTGWTFLVAARRSYFDLWLKPLLSGSSTALSGAPAYYDYQAILQRDFAAGGSLRLFFFGSRDDLSLVAGSSGADPTLAGAASQHVESWRIQALYTQKLSDASELRLTGSLGRFQANRLLGGESLNETAYPVDYRFEYRSKLARWLRLNVGTDSTFLPYKADATLPPILRLGQPPPGPFATGTLLTAYADHANLDAGAYAELEATPWQGARLVPGIRVDHTSETREWDVSPRITVRQDVVQGPPRTTVKAAAGLFYQQPLYYETNPIFGQTGLVNNRAAQYDVGVEQEITPSIEATLDGFYKRLDRLVVVGLRNQGSGNIYGLEALVRYKADARFFGWLSYTLTHSDRRDSAQGPTYAFDFDQTHILTAVGSYRLGRGWEMGARFRVVSGNPITPESDGYVDLNAGVNLALIGQPPNSDRLPLFHQLDVRVEKTWTFPVWKLRAYLDVQNVYDYQAAEDRIYDYDATKYEYAKGLPILPSLGIRGEI